MWHRSKGGLTWNESTRHPDMACADSLTAQNEWPQVGAPWVMRLHKSIIKGPLITKVPGVRHMGQQWHRFRTRYSPTAVWKVIRCTALDLRGKWTKKDHFSVGQSALMQDETITQILWYYLFAIRTWPIQYIGHHLLAHSNSSFCFQPHNIPISRTVDVIIVVPYRDNKV